MKYYKDTAGNVYAYNDIQTPKDGLFEMSQDEIDAHLNPPIQPQTAEEVRAQRDARIEAVRWRIERYDDELRLKIDPTEPIDPLLQYVQALRDVPEQSGFPEDIDWPEQPDS